MPPSDLVLRTCPNWTAVGFLGLLAALHFSNAGISFFGGQYEGYLSLIFACGLTVAAVACSRFRFELALLGSQRRSRLRNGISGRLCAERFIPFASVRGVRLTMSNGGKSRWTESRIELICPHEDVECPPTAIPRQEALFLSILMGVPLIKVTE